jgi:hypothetical protein
MDRQYDPRRLSKKHPGRSEIQDDPPSLPPPSPFTDNRETSSQDPSPTARTLKKRALRRRGAVPPGTDKQN